MLDHFENKMFLNKPSQAFPSSKLSVAFYIEERDFKKTVQSIAINKIPKAPNIINSHVIYKIKHNDDKNLNLKARIVPHGNEDSMRD